MPDTVTLDTKSRSTGLWSAATIPWQAALPWQFPYDGAFVLTLDTKN